MGPYILYFYTYSIVYFDFELDTAQFLESCLVTEIFDDMNNSVMDQNLILFKLPKEMRNLSSDAGIEIVNIAIDDNEIIVTLENQMTALFIYLQSSVIGNFDDNAFSLVGKGTKTIRFKPQLALTPETLQVFRDTLRINHLGHATMSNP